MLHAGKSPASLPLCFLLLMSSPQQIGERRKSFFEGPNSIQNFALLYVRALQYLHLEVDDELLPNTLPLLLPAATPSYTSPHPRALSDFSFPENEAGLVPMQLRLRRSLLRFDFGQLTGPQTVFNAVNVLVGIGILSLPLALHLAGWVGGVLLLTLAALSSMHTAQLLGRVMARVKTVTSFGEIAGHCFGPGTQYAILGVFCVDLIGATVLLILLFSDLVQEFVQVEAWKLKLAIVAIVFVLSYLPLHLLSFLSLVGVISTTAVVVLCVVCGFLSSTSPGLLLTPAATTLWPKDMALLLLAIGICMAPWGGHLVFPELYRDMRHPNKYDKCVGITFAFLYAVDLWLAAVGYLMFGNGVTDEITKNLVRGDYPAWVATSIAALMALLPLLKAPLILKPVTTAAELMLLLTGKLTRHRVLRVVVKVALFALYFGVSVGVLLFGRVMAFLGSAVCFTICISCPLMFYLNVFGDELGARKRVYQLALAASVTLTVVGTYAAVCM